MFSLVSINIEFQPIYQPFYHFQFHLKFMKLMNDTHIPLVKNHFTLTHWGLVTHKCISKLTIIGSDNGLSPSRHQAIVWTKAGLLLIWPLGTNFSEILFKIHIFSFRKMHLKMSSGKTAAILSRPHWEVVLLFHCMLQLLQRMYGQFQPVWSWYVTSDWVYCGQLLMDDGMHAVLCAHVNSGTRVKTYIMLPVLI